LCHNPFLMSEERDLIQRISRGDTDAFRELFAACYRSLFSYALSLVIDRETAKDIIQDVFFRIWENRKNFEIHTSLKAFLFASVRNSAIDHIRKQKRFSGYERELVEILSGQTSSGNAAPEPLNSIIYNETCDIVESAIEKLPEQCRRIFIMSRFHGLKHKQIPEKLDISSRTVEAHIYAALKFLRETVKKSLSD